MFGFVYAPTGAFYLYDSEDDARAAASDMGMTNYTVRVVRDHTTSISRENRRRAREAADRAARQAARQAATPDPGSMAEFLGLGR